ncbi:VOC family protein [Hyalangium gracile]|uniref:VOC family protein n=1 Tax=Hyalangium gracile TaxID=394092 RepID=UPI00295EAFD5|nr:VOC family protein [Hyalangium gracile]
MKVRDIEASKRFYRAVFEALGIPFGGERPGAFWADEFYVSAEEPVTQKMHLAFQAKDRETVHRFHAAALAGGGRDNGGPGERHYHPGYYAAFALDPDGNNIEAVFHGPSRRSAESIVVTPGG